MNRAPFSITSTMSMKRCTFLLVTSCLVLVCAHQSTEEDVYLARSLQECNESKGVFVCFKYRIAKFFANYVHHGFGYDVTLNTPVEDMPRVFGIRAAVVRTSNQQHEKQSRVFSDTDETADEGELERISKFLYRQVNGFIGTHSLVVPLTTEEQEGRAAQDTPQIVNLEDYQEENNQQIEEGRASKKKSIAYLVPLLALFKLKALMIPTLISVLVIKKILVLLTIALPYFLHMIKLCKSPHHEHIATSYHSVPTWVHGHDHHGWGGHNYGGHDDYRWHRRHGVAVTARAAEGPDTPQHPEAMRPVEQDHLVVDTSHDTTFKPDDVSFSKRISDGIRSSAMSE